MQKFGDKFGINTYSYTQALSAADCLRHLADLGVKCFELMFYPGHLWITDGAKALSEIRGIVSDNGLKIASLNSPNIDLNVAAATKEMRQHCLKLNRGFLRVAGELGAGGVILGPGKANPLFSPPAGLLEGYFFEALDDLLPLADECGVKIFIENMPFAFLPGAKQLMDTLDRYGSDEIEVCYDVANGHFIGEDPCAGLKIVAPRLGLVHLSDTTRKAFRHDAIGLGDLDFSPIPAAIEDAEFKGPILLEVISENGDQHISASIKVLEKFDF